MNKETFTNRKGDHYNQHQWFAMPYIYVYVAPSIKVITWKISSAIFVITKRNSTRWCFCVKNDKSTLWKRFLFSWLHFDDRWNVFAKICIVSTRKVDVDEEGNSYKGIVAFVVAELKQCIPFVVQAIAEVRFNGQRLAEKISDNIDNLTEIRPCVQVIVTDSHSANVNEFSTLIKKYSVQNQIII